MLCTFLWTKNYLSFIFKPLQSSPAQNTSFHHWYDLRRGDTLHRWFLGYTGAGSLGCPGSKTGNLACQGRWQLESENRTKIGSELLVPHSSQLRTSMMTVMSSRICMPSSTMLKPCEYERQEPCFIIGMIVSTTLVCCLSALLLV